MNIPIAKLILLLGRLLSRAPQAENPLISDPNASSQSQSIQLVNNLDPAETMGACLPGTPFCPMFRKLIHNFTAPGATSPYICDMMSMMDIFDLDHLYAISEHRNDVEIREFPLTGADIKDRDRCDIMPISQCLILCKTAPSMFTRDQFSQNDIPDVCTLPPNPCYSHSTMLVNAPDATIVNDTAHQPRVVDNPELSEQAGPSDMPHEFITPKPKHSHSNKRQRPSVTAKGPTPPGNVLDFPVSAAAFRVECFPR